MAQHPLHTCTPQHSDFYMFFWDKSQVFMHIQQVFYWLSNLLSPNNCVFVKIFVWPYQHLLKIFNLNWDTKKLILFLCMYSLYPVSLIRKCQKFLFQGYFNNTFYGPYDITLCHLSPNQKYLLPKIAFLFFFK